MFTSGLEIRGQCLLLPAVPNGSFLFPLPGSARFYAHSIPNPTGYSHFLALSIPYCSTSSHLLRFEIIKPINCSKLTTMETSDIKTTKNKVKIKNKNVPIGSLFSNSGLSSNNIRTTYACYLVLDGKCKNVVFSFPPMSTTPSSRSFCFPRNDSSTSRSHVIPMGLMEIPDILSPLTAHFAYKTVRLLLAQFVYWVSRSLCTYTVIQCTARIT